MNINTACCSILSHLDHLLTQITAEDFTKPVKTLDGATIGQHLRHTLEFFYCLQKGVEKGVVNYDKRAHDKKIENNKAVAASTLHSLLDFVRDHDQNEVLKLEVDYDLNVEHFETVETNYRRELVYNIEHAVHHMAIIKIGLREIAPYIALPADFGVASSTLQYNKTLAESHG